MASLQTIEIVIEAVDNASSPINNIGVSLSNLGNIVTGIKSGFDLLGSAFTAIVDTIGMVKDAVVAVAEPIIDFGMESIMTAARLDELRIVNEVLAKNADIPIAAVRGEAEAVRNMGIEAGIAEEVMASFIRSNLDLGKASDLARVAQDAAVISGSNSSETLDKLIYGIETLNPLILRNAGITLDAQEVYKAYAKATDQKVTALSAEEKQQALLNAVLREGVAIQGAYEAAMTNPFKMIGSFPRMINDIMVAVGGPFQEAFGMVVFTIRDILVGIRGMVEEGGAWSTTLENMAGVAEKIALAFSVLIDAGFNSLEFKESLSMFFNDETIAKMEPFLELLDRATNLISTFFDVGGDINASEFQEAWGYFVDGIQNATDAVLGAGSFDKIVSFVDTIKGLFIDIKEGDWAGVWATVKDALAPLGPVISDALEYAWNWARVKIIEWWNNIDWPAIYDNIDTFVANMIQRIDQAVSAWIQSGGADQLGAKFLNWVNALADPDNPELKSKTMAAALNLMRTLIRAFAALPWEEFYIGFTQLIGKAFLSIDWEWIFVWLMEAVGKVFVGAIAAALNVAGYALKTVIDGFINKIKQFFGISSPSTVFAAIGRELVLGLIAGWSTTFSLLIAIVTADLAKIAAMFTGAGLGAVFGGGDGRGTGDLEWGTAGSTGTVGGRSTGGATQTSGTVNNYYYGPVYFGAAGEPGAYYDCPSPSPFITATASGGGGGRPATMR